MKPTQTWIIACLCMLFVQHDIFAQDCSKDTSGLIPLVDLGTGYYEGHQGGLYPGGSNVMPYNHYQAGMKAAKRMKPLNVSGNVDPVNGKIVIAVIGPSIASHTINRFEDSMLTWAGINPCLQIINATIGGKGMELMYGDTAAWYFNNVKSKIESQGSSLEQVQILWFYHSIKGLSGSDAHYIDSTVYIFKQILPVVQGYFHNVRQFYISGIHYGNYVDPLDKFYTERLEPASYKNNIAVKELIADQINGDPELAYQGYTRRCPWLAWGPNFWADGKNARSYDGLQWNCSDFRLYDGYHNSDAGEVKEVHLLQTFLENNAYASFWYLDSPGWTSCNALRQGSFDNTVLENETSDFMVWIYPEPGQQSIYVDFQGSAAGLVHTALYTIGGGLVFAQNNYHDSLADEEINISTAGLSPGLYLASFELNGKVLTSKIVIQ